MVGNINGYNSIFDAFNASFNNNDIYTFWDDMIKVAEIKLSIDTNITFECIYSIITTTNFSDYISRFLFTIIHANKIVGSNIRALFNNRLIYYKDIIGNVFIVNTLTTINDGMYGFNDFSQTIVRLNSDLSGNKVLICMPSILKYEDRDQDMGFFIKEFKLDFSFNADTSIGITDDYLHIVDDNNLYGTNYIVTTNKTRTSYDLSCNIVKMLLDNNGEYFISLNFNIVKIPDNPPTYSTSFLITITTTGFFLIISNNTIEYAINKLKFIEDSGISIEKRSARRLINNGLLPVIGRYNGWTSRTNNINWNLYNSKYDKDISIYTLKYFWVILYAINISQDIKFIVNNNIEINTDISSNRTLLWYSDITNNPPTNSDFGLIGSVDMIKQLTSYNITNFNKLDFQCNDNILYPTELYFESFGYSYLDNSMNTIPFNLATRQLYDSRISNNEQISLTNYRAYEALSKFINYNSALPTDRYITSSNNISASDEEKTSGSVGWYLNTNRGIKLNLLDNTEALRWSNIETLFIEVIVSNSSDISFNAYDNIVNKNNISSGHKIFYYKTDPYDMNYFKNLSIAYKSNTYDIFDNIVIIDGSLNSMIIEFTSNVEIISFGYKSYGRNPIHYMTKWNSNEINPLIRTIDGYFGLVNKSQPQNVFITDDVFSVKAYGDFFEGNYMQRDNSGNDVVVNAKLNKDALKRACYILESYANNNYTIDPTGLKYTTDVVGIVDRYGNIMHKNDNINEIQSSELMGILVNNQYIVGDFQGTIITGTDALYLTNNNVIGSDVQPLLPPIQYEVKSDSSLNNISESTFIKELPDGMKIFVNNGGLNPVILQGLYAALFKKFNKSTSILNSQLMSSIVNNVKDSNLLGDASSNNTSALLTGNTSYGKDAMTEANLSLDSQLYNAFLEEDNPYEDSNLFKLYKKSGRLLEDRSIYSNNKRGGSGTNIDNNLYLSLQQGMTITMNLEDMELRFKVKLRGSIFDNISTLQFTKSNANKVLVERIFGKYNNGVMEPQTLIREVRRIDNTPQGKDEKGNILSMLNNLDASGNIVDINNINQKFAVNSEMQYEIIFKITLIQKKFKF